jgi:site-specific recombinase
MAWTNLLRRREKRARSAPGLDTLCEFAPARGTQQELVFWFLELVAWVRPVAGQPVEVRLRYLAAQLERHPDWRDKVARALSRLVESCDVGQLLAYAGVPRDFHLSGALLGWATAKLLPAACDTHDAAQIFSMALRLEDMGWLRSMDQASGLLGLIDPALHEPLRTAVAQSLVDLSHEVVSQAHSSGLKGLTDMARSPFRGLYEAVQALNRDPTDANAARALLGRIRQCETAVEAQRVGLAERGASMNTTFQLLRLRRQLRRLSLLAQLHHDPSPQRIWSALGDLCEGALRAAAGGRLLWGSSYLVVQNLVDTTAAVGRDYLDPGHGGGWAAFRAGAGGGALMAVATALKFLLTSLHLPKLYEGLAYSLNYAAAFSAAYLLHCTIATKLPAHTAAALARGLQQGGSLRVRLDGFVVTWRAMVRLQLLGLLGNVVIAAPLAAALAFGFDALFQRPLLTPAKATHVLETQSLLGPSILYAALTGVLLWISSLAGAWVDNWARVTRLSDRLATNVHALRAHADRRARERAERLTSKVGGLAANIALGFMLGGVPTAFALAELPIEIRHVTVSVGSVAMAWIAGAREVELWWLAGTGVVAIGLTNVVVSFSLALRFALASMRGMGGRYSSALLSLGIRRWARGKGTLPRRTSAPVVKPATL